MEGVSNVAWILDFQPPLRFSTFLMSASAASTGALSPNVAKRPEGRVEVSQKHSTCWCFWGARE